MPKLQLRPLRSVSPALAEVMRACQLHAGLARTDGASFQFVLGNPKAWLGTAYHFVLERILGAIAKGEALDVAVQRFWNEGIAEQEKRASGHPLDRRFGKPESWPGYFLVQASVMLRAKQLAATATSVDVAPSSSTTVREKEFAAFSGKLLGRPDVVREGEIVDYKSGAIFEYDEDAQEDVVKAAFVRQLRIYAFLVNENLGWWPTRGVLLPFVGAPVEVALDPTDCEREATEAVALLDGYNDKLHASADTSGLASPSPGTCNWCPFKIICPPFWQNVSPAWANQLFGAAIEGTLVGDPASIAGGDAVGFSLHFERGTEQEGLRRITPLDVTSHPGAATLREGDRVRITGLRARPDGGLVPSQRTVVTRAADIPKITADLHDQ